MEEEVVIVSAPTLARYYKPKIAEKVESKPKIASKTQYAPQRSRIISETLWENIQNLERQILHNLILGKKESDFIIRLNEKYKININPYATVSKTLVSKFSYAPILKHRDIDRLKNTKIIYEYGKAFNSAFINMTTRYNVNFIKKMNMKDIVNSNPEQPTPELENIDLNLIISGKNIYHKSGVKKKIKFGKKGNFNLMKLEGKRVSVSNKDITKTGIITDFDQILDDSDKTTKSATRFARQVNKSPDPEGDIRIIDTDQNIRDVRRTYEIYIFDMLRKRIIDMYDKYMASIYSDFEDLVSKPIEPIEEEEEPDFLQQQEDIGVSNTQAEFVLPKEGKGKKATKIVFDIDECLFWPTVSIDFTSTEEEKLINEIDIIDLGLATFPAFLNKITTPQGKDFQNKEFALEWNNTQKEIGKNLYKKIQAEKVTLTKEQKQAKALKIQQKEEAKKESKKRAAEKRKSKKEQDKLTKKSSTESAIMLADKPKKNIPKGKRKDSEKPPERSSSEALNVNLNISSAQNPEQDSAEDNFIPEGLF